MHNILEALWDVRIRPHELYIEGDSKYIAAMRKAASEKSRLLSSMSPAQQTALEKLTDAQLEAESLADRAAFAFGFRFALQLLADGSGCSPESFI